MISTSSPVTPRTRTRKNQKMATAKQRAAARLNLIKARARRWAGAARRFGGQVASNIRASTRRGSRLRTRGDRLRRSTTRAVSQVGGAVAGAGRSAARTAAQAVSNARSSTRRGSRLRVRGSRVRASASRNARRIGGAVGGARRSAASAMSRGSRTRRRIARAGRAVRYDTPRVLDGAGRAVRRASGQFGREMGRRARRTRRRISYRTRRR